MPSKFSPASDLFMREFVEDLRVYWGRHAGSDAATLAACFGVSLSTFRRRLDRARQRGYLPPAAGTEVFNPFPVQR